jgi:hypothetical protein
MHLFSSLALLAGFTALLWGRPICVGARLLSFWRQHCAAPVRTAILNGAFAWRQGRLMDATVLSEPCPVTWNCWHRLQNKAMVPVAGRGCGAEVKARPGGKVELGQTMMEEAFCQDAKCKQEHRLCIRMGGMASICHPHSQQCSRPLSLSACNSCTKEPLPLLDSPTHTRTHSMYTSRSLMPTASHHTQ